jgi:hypothetical protein
LDTIKKLVNNPVALSYKNIKKAASAAYYIPATFLARRKLQTLA